jgi:hypothetical protein
LALRKLDGVIAVRNDRQPSPEKRLHAHPAFAILAPHVFPRNRRFPFEFGDKLKRGSPFLDVPTVLGRVERDPRCILRYSNKNLASRISAVAQIQLGP